MSEKEKNEKAWANLKIKLKVKIHEKDQEHKVN